MFCEHISFMKYLNLAITLLLLCHNQFIVKKDNQQRSRTIVQKNFVADIQSHLPLSMKVLVKSPAIIAKQNILIPLNSSEMLGHH